MRAWWFHLSLHNKLQIPIQLLSLIVLFSAQIWVKDEFEKNLFQGAERRAVSSATQSFLALNSMMLAGNISQLHTRKIYLAKMSNQDGVKDFHIARSQSLLQQYGAGLPEERERDELDRKALSSNEVQIQYVPENKLTLRELPQKALRVVVPFAAYHGAYGVDCLQCHHVAEGTVNGAVSLTVGLDHEYA